MDRVLTQPGGIFDLPVLCALQLTLRARFGHSLAGWCKCLLHGVIDWLFAFVERLYVLVEALYVSIECKHLRENTPYVCGDAPHLSGI